MPIYKRRQLIGRGQSAYVDPEREWAVQHDRQPPRISETVHTYRTRKLLILRAPGRACPASRSLLSSHNQQQLVALGGWLWCMLPRPTLASRKQTFASTLSSSPCSSGLAGAGVRSGRAETMQDVHPLPWRPPANKASFPTLASSLKDATTIDSQEHHPTNTRLSSSWTDFYQVYDPIRTEQDNQPTCQTIT